MYIMRNKHLLTTLCLLLLCFNIGKAQQNNVLSIPDVTVPVNKSISLPIELNNTADVVAVEFNLTVPEGITLTPADAKLSERSDGHAVTMRSVGNNKYKVLIFSSSNKAIKGRAGELMTVTLSAASSLEEGKDYPMALEDVIIGGKNGDNLTTGYSAGKVTIAKSPDFEVSNVLVNPTTVVLGGKISVSWSVANVGELPTTSGCSEQIYFDAEDGTSKLIGTVYHEGTLNAGEVESRSAEFVIPAIVGIDGTAHVRVKLKANSDSGEPSWLTENNEATSSEAINVAKQLTLTPAEINVEEKSNQNIRFYLTRSGSAANDETFTLTRDADDRVSLPESVTILKGQSGVYLYAQMKANEKLDDESAVTFAISGNGYEEVSSKIVIDDDTYPSLSIVGDAQDVTEGGHIKFTIFTERISSQDIEVKLTCDFPSRFEIPSSIIIPAGKPSVDVVVAAKDDAIPDVEQVVTFVATAAMHNSASTNIVLLDNDVPTLKLELSPNAVSEAAGPLAVTARLSRIDNIDKLVTVKFSDDSNGNIYYGRQTVEMAAGVKEVTVNLGPVDNAIVDGERTYNISAAVYIASCSCNANNGTSGGVVSAPLTVYDNDGPTLTMATSSSILKEGGEIEVTVARNTDTSVALTVSLSSDHDDSIEYPSTVVIPAGKSQATFIVKSKENDVTGDGFTAMLTAKADGFATGNVWFTISDQTLPDAQITDITVSAEEVEVGETINVEVTLANTGSYELPELTKVGIYLTNSFASVATIYLQEPLPAGESVTVSREIAMPLATGTYRIYAVANDGNVAKELSYTNNTSKMFAIKVVSPYRVSAIRADNAIYNQQETAVISGEIEGNVVADQKVEIYVINENYRHTINVTTDAEGHFSTDYTPYPGQMGHFAVGGCYPNEGLRDEMTSFDVYGLRRADNSYITCNAVLDETYTGRFSVVNPGILSLSGVKAEVVSKPSNCSITVTCPETAEAGKPFDVEFSINATSQTEGTDWQLIVINLTTAEGATLSTTLYYYCSSPQGYLKSNQTSINTTMTKGSTRYYPLTITNIGRGETGKITLSLPSWIKTATPKEMASLASGDTTTVILMFTPTEQMQLNVPVTDYFSINCTNGKGLDIPFTIEAVSDENGTLIVDVCDEYTYYTAEGPHVSGANVKVRQPYTGKLIAEGVTGDAGTCTFNDLPEGYYELYVTADRHDSYTNFCYVDPGRTNTERVNLSYQAISILWDVEETEIEDEYHIETKVVYETNVPAPVVKVTLPDSIDGENMAVGDATMIYMTLTNVGLINAINTTLSMPEDMHEWTFEPLAYTEPFTLHPNQSVLVPILITRVSDGTEAMAVRRKATSVEGSIEGAVDDMFRTYRECRAIMGAWYEHECGDDIKKNKSAERLAMKGCAYLATAKALGDIIGDIFGGFKPTPGNPGTGPTRPIKPKPTGPDNQRERIPEIQKTLNICDPCHAAIIEKLVGKALKFTFVGKLDEAIDKAIEMHQEGSADGLKIEVIDVYKVTRDFVVNTVLGDYADMFEIMYDVYDLISECNKSKDNNESASVQSRKKASSYGWQDEFNTAAYAYIDHLKTIESIMLCVYGDRFWFEDIDEEKLAFLDYVDGMPKTYVPTDEELMMHKPEAASLEQARAYINHIRNGVDDIEDAEFLSLIDTYSAGVESAKIEGFTTMTDKFEKAYNDYYQHFMDMQSSSVCASISLKFEQSMVMTRQAFKGTLTVYNGHETTAMTDVKLHLTVKDKDGNFATSHEFQIDAEKLTGFDGALSLTDGWTLDAQQEGVATVKFTPTKYAAPTEGKVYYFGGSLSYIDPFTDLEVTRLLAPIALTVNPTPNLNLTYFMQRNVLGDDPLTPAVEPCEDAEFSLLINNIGYGDAKNLVIQTEQPQIIDNEKGLLIDFELISSQLNGGDKDLALGGIATTDFGTIPSMSTAYAQWWFRSSMLGHFTDYDVTVTHVTGKDNKDLSLLNEVTIHELIRSLDIVDGSGNKMVGFMTNDIVDAEDTPDMIYLSNGDIESVATVKGASMQRTSETTYTLTVASGQMGWNYGNVSDPTYGIAKLASVIRQSDNKEMPLRNFWQTDRTLRDGKEPLYENRIHFADDMASVEETYILTFEPTPELLLEVVAIEGVPAEGTLCTSPVESVNVVFNKYIDPSTFTTDDITLAVQGEKQDVSSVAISTEDNKTFKLDFAEINKTVGNGYFVLTVQTAEVTDYEGYNGKVGKSVGWVMFRDGSVAINISSSPSQAGTVRLNGDEVTSPSCYVQHGETVTLEAIPSEGYEFQNWTINGMADASSPELERMVLSDMNVVANYVPKNYAVTVTASEGGQIVGAGTGIYPYGGKLLLTAQADEDYSFADWSVNGASAEGAEKELAVTVEGSMDILANFNRELYQYSMALSNGWNWISNYLNEPVPVNSIIANATRIISQFDEVVNDPEYGMIGGFDALEPGVAYKVNTSSYYSAVRSVKGHKHDIENNPIKIRNGWNWISYPYYEKRPIDAVVRNASEGDFIVSQDGFAEFADGIWGGTLAEFIPGAGYLYYMSASGKTTLEFDFTKDAASAPSPAKSRIYAVAPASGPEVDKHKYPSTMNVTAKVCMYDTELTDADYVIYAMADNECRGKSVVGSGGTHYLTVYGDQPVAITFVVVDTKSDDTYVSSEVLTFQEDVIGSRKSPYIINIDAPTGIASLADTPQKMKVYSIEGILIDSEATPETIKRLQRGIYIINGKKFWVK